MVRRIAVIEKDKCNPVGCGDFLCVRVSPGNRMGKEVFVRGEDGKASVNEDVCTDAESITVKKCPFGAIHMVNLPDRLTRTPIHRYGSDGFVLYNVPVPSFGKVVGIIGANGVGKSTTLRIFSKEVMPNLGVVDSVKGFDLDRVIELFRGSEIQNYFEKVKSGDIRIAYKPQQIDLIAKFSKGNVKELLEGVNENGKLEEYAEALGIKRLFSSDVSSISGGELQRVAICATLVKDANVFVFDEPTSYLDIFERINVANFLRGLVRDDVGIVVVEHDLVVLDFLADLTHLVFGESGAYGIVSQPKHTRNAINVYLDGFLKEENMRFRDHAITFSSSPDSRVSSDEVLLEWKDLSVKLDKFELSSGVGCLKKKQVVGVFGRNGIGKTTFAKVLAGVVKCDSGSLSSEVSVSYKPQYLETESDELVESFLGDVVEKYRHSIIRPLHIEHLLLRKLNELSGGELQRVSIAKCLSAESDVYLLDEPSAYLDVEQRLVVAKLIKERVDQTERTALVVDHDLIFIDSVSDDLMIFSGEPGSVGRVDGIFSMRDGMNSFLSSLGITLRRDEESKRPRINSKGSRLDNEQKASGNYYYE